jgi:hypothetical protein
MSDKKNTWGGIERADAQPSARMQKVPSPNPTSKLGKQALLNEGTKSSSMQKIPTTTATKGMQSANMHPVSQSKSTSTPSSTPSGTPTKTPSGNHK